MAATRERRWTTPVEPAGRAGPARVWSWAWLPVLLAAGAAGQTDDPKPLPGEPRHGLCHTTGKLEVELDRRWAIEEEHGDTWQVVFCSEAIASPNMALDWEPCSRCKTPSLKAAAQVEYEGIRRQNEEWLADRREVDRVAALKKVVHVETTHFVLAWDIPKITTAKKKTYRMHEAAHLYTRRLEEAYADIQQRFGILDENNMRNKHTFLFFEKQSPMMRAGPVFTGLQGTGTLKRSGGVNQESTVVGWWNRGENPSDADLHRHLVHTLVHQMTSVLYDVRWFGPGEVGLSPPWLLDKYGWLDAGLAHWFEHRLPGDSTTYCMREQDASRRWKGKDWRKNIWKAVMAETVLSFSEVSTKPTQSLSPMEHQFCWSWVDFLLDRDEAGMGMALRLAKEKRPAREMLKQVWGLSVIGFEQDWIEWVKVQYAPTRKRR